MEKFKSSQISLLIFSVFLSSCASFDLTGKMYTHINPDNTWHLELSFPSDSTFYLKNAKALPNFFSTKGKVSKKGKNKFELVFKNEYAVNLKPKIYVLEMPKKGEPSFAHLPFTDIDTLILTNSGKELNIKKLHFYLKE